MSVETEEAAEPASVVAAAEEAAEVAVADVATLAEASALAFEFPELSLPLEPFEPSEPLAPFCPFAPAFAFALALAFALASPDAFPWPLDLAAPLAPAFPFSEPLAETPRVKSGMGKEIPILAQNERAMSMACSANLFTCATGPMLVIDCLLSYGITYQGCC